MSLNRVQLVISSVFVSYICQLSACSQFNVSHSGLNIAQKLMVIMDSFGIRRKVWVVLTDGARPMIKCKYSSLFLGLDTITLTLFTLGGCQNSTFP